MILHITNDFSGSTVYMNLFKELDKLGLSQVVYHPTKDSSRKGINEFTFNDKDSKIIYSNLLNKHFDRIFYQKKIKKILKDIEEKVDLTKITMIHAHTWFSDGGVAYEISKKYKIPYVIAVRNTDLNIFLKYFRWELAYSKLILSNAKEIITISPVYQKRLLNDFKLKDISGLIASKISYIPNGVDAFWIKNRSIKAQNNDPKKFLYIGNFNKSKNVYNLVKAFEILSHKHDDLHLTLVGGTGMDQKKILNFINRFPDVFTFKGVVKSKIDLNLIYEDSDFFVMPSIKETFGLVYVEALLKGLPVLYTLNEGIDGAYDNIGEKITENSIQCIEQKLCDLLNNYNNYVIDYDALVLNHDWSNIAKAYLDIYKF